MSYIFIEGKNGLRFRLSAVNATRAIAETQALPGGQPEYVGLTGKWNAQVLMAGKPDWLTVHTAESQEEAQNWLNTNVNSVAS